jgi:hypothetical protein
MEKQIIVSNENDYKTVQSVLDAFLMMIDLFIQ